MVNNRDESRRYVKWRSAFTVRRSPFSVLARGISARLRLAEARSIPDLPWHAWTGEIQLCTERRYGRMTWREYLRQSLHASCLPTSYFYSSPHRAI
jgi:hypothetical protein